jgi:hypothetical protein
MKSTTSSIRSLTGCAGAGVFLVSLAATAWAQGSATAPPPGAGQPGILNPKMEDRQRQLAEGRLRSAEMDAVVESENQKRIQAALVHMKEDFTRIQVLRNDIARSLVAHKPVDYALVAGQTAEINKRANELNVYMMARSSEEKAHEKSADLTSGEMVGALVKLCKLIDSFTENPSLKNAATLDVREVEKARNEKAKADHDLLAIIKLSENIEKASDSLKSPKQ